MGEEPSHMVERILQLTLEIICLLTGEIPPFVSGDHVTIKLPSPRSLTPEGKTQRRILDVINKIAELLTGEDEDLMIEKVVVKEEAEATGEERLAEGGVSSDVDADPRDTAMVQRNMKTEGDKGRFERIKKEDMSVEISTAGRHKRTNATGVPLVGNSITPVLRISSLPSHPSTQAISYSSRSHPVTNHTRQRHPKKFQCPECGKSFSTKSYLNKHKIVHTSYKPFSCSECGKCFSRKSVLVIHERIHTGKKPYSCSECGKCFLDKWSLFKHSQLHSGERPYACSQCEKSFTDKWHLIKHAQVHTGEKPFSCSQCGKCFYNTSLLNQHKRVHTGEKPYSCPECGKSFSRKSSLVIHERIHTGEKPFSCSECGNRFSRKSELIKHDKLHNNTNPC